MSSAYPSDPPRWWSLGPKQPVRQQGLQRQYSTDKSSRSGGLNSLAVALGFKSKKHPLLAIQDPVYPSSRPSIPTIVTKAANRPPSKSVSSTRSRVDSFGPPTPQDPRKDIRHSLLTISDTDPFAVRAIVSAPHTPSDPNRLSVYSNASSPDFMSKSAEPILHRASYGSSSSQSNAHGSDLSPLTPTSPDLQKKLKSKKSVGSLHRKQSLMAGDQSLGSAWESISSQATKSAMAKATSPSASTPDKNRFSQPEANPTPRPPMRARGMTDSRAGHQPYINAHKSTTAPTSSSHTPRGPSPRVIIRQPSASRIGLPTSAPPTQGLPPPPVVECRNEQDDDFELVPPVVSTCSASSSTVSFASSTSSRKDIMFNQSYSPRKKPKPLLSRSSSAGAASVLDTSHTGLVASAPPHTLKKAMSHQSFGRRPPPSNNSVPLPLPEIPAPSKAPRKQRSFHQPKFPLPPLSPLRPSTSFGTQTSSPVADISAPTEQRRGSGLSLPGRKRLFSGSNSRRPSTSQAAFTEENDSQSIFSVRSVPDQNTGSSIFKSMGQPLSPTLHSSFWDEGSPLDNSSRTISHEYTPQQIMTPAEMAKLEASVDVLETPDRQRTLSVLSASTMTSVLSGGELGTSPANSVLADVGSINAATNKLMARSTSLMQKGLSAPPMLSVRPSTSQAGMTSPTISERNYPISSPLSPSPSMTSLPPPPRRPRPRPTLVDDDPILPSLPPPPGRRFVRPKISVEKLLHRRSIMRKPSFLEISDDESDNDTDMGSLEEPPSGSFLDLARESFDTTRSISE
ncbi:hypothetical protein H0H87_004535 [Tephrocybe sp. NHM501043]|nr:hypothetical protein H0H87_004535 [Tephrocybe sp. NHM501043]